MNAKSQAWLLTVCAALVTLVAGTTMCAGEDEASNGYSISFVDADGKPIERAIFDLYELKDGQFQSARFRGHDLGEEARIELAEMPAEYAIGVASTKYHYYEYCWSSSKLFSRSKLHLKKGNNVVVVPRTGTVVLTFSRVGPGVNNNPESRAGVPIGVSLHVYRKSLTGEYILCTEHTSGWVLKEGREWDCRGLPPDDYKFEVRTGDDASVVCWSREGIFVREMALIRLDKLEARIKQK